MQCFTCHQNDETQIDRVVRQWGPSGAISIHLVKHGNNSVCELSLSRPCVVVVAHCAKRLFCWWFYGLLLGPRVYDCNTVVYTCVRFSRWSFAVSMKPKQHLKLWQGCHQCLLTRADSWHLSYWGIVGVSITAMCREQWKCQRTKLSCRQNAKPPCPFHPPLLTQSATLSILCSCMCVSILYINMGGLQYPNFPRLQIDDIMHE